MIKIILLFILPISIFGSKILSYNIYDRTDRADVMITFDVPYHGVIKKSISSTSSSTRKILVKLEGASIESSKLKQVSSKYIKTLAITPLSNYVQLIASVTDGVDLKVSKTADAYGLRLRFQKNVTTTNKTEAKLLSMDDEQPTNLSHLPTKKADDMTQSYYIVVTILVIGILILFYIKRKVTPKNNTFQDKQTKDQKQTDLNVISNSNGTQNTDVSIRFQKSIDENNSVVMLDFMDQSYLVMMGSNNVLLDRFSDDKPTSQEEFNVILQDHQQMLDNFLNSHEIQNDSGVKSYSQKASTISYNA
ncbi:hypothetical protein [Sulfurimonas sp.]|uniref:hypothetical protein n=1 Tax=Sulfurimonas sp. TaxID=2022749 RepID=UPI00356364EC